MRSSRFKLLLNTITFVLLLFVNYLSNTKIFSRSIGDISKKYDSLIVPAGYAFSIWGLIYLMLIGFIIHQWVRAIKYDDSEVIEQTGLWFTISNLCNAAWVLCWIDENMEGSLLVMIALLFSLIILVRNLKLEIWDAPIRIIAFVWWPISVYIGWIIIATVANVAAFFVSIGWNGGIFLPEIWTIIMIGVSVIIYALLIYKRNMREAAMVGVWAYIAIAIRQWEMNKSIVVTCFIAMAILLLYSSWHAWQNRATLPFLRKRK